MDKKALYLLKEEAIQVNYKTKAKYLYKSEFINKVVTYFDLIGVKYLFISNNYGILEPNQLIEPYNIKDLKSNSLKMWTLLTYQLIDRYMKENDLKSIICIYSGNKYNKLENMLKEEYEIETPIKYYVSKDLKLKWINDIIIKNINNRLSC